MIIDACSPCLSQEETRPRRTGRTVEAVRSRPAEPLGAEAAATPVNPIPETGSEGPASRGGRPMDDRGDFILRLYLRDLAHGEPEAPGLELDTSRARVVAELPRVVRMAFDYQGFGLPLGDLINEGNLGLMRAAELFDPARQVRFSYYAKPWIRVQMQRALSYQAWPVSLPADFSWRHGQVLGAEERLATSLNRVPGDAEIADECGLGVPAVRRLRTTPTPSFLPLDDPWQEGEAGMTLSEVIPDEAARAPDAEVALLSDREYIDGLMEALTPAEQSAIRLRFGLDDGQRRTLEEVGETLGFGRQSAHRLERTALAKLRARAEANPEPVVCG